MSVLKAAFLGIGIAALCWHGEGSYDSVLAQHMILFSDAAYCGGSASEGQLPLQGAHDIASWSCPPCRAAAALSGGGGSLTSVEIFSEPSEGSFGFTGFSADGPTGASIVVSYRGSVVEPNFREDEAQKPLVDFRGLGAVQAGFFRMYSASQLQMLQQVNSLRARFPFAKTLLATGHSSGASLALLAAIDLYMAHKDMEVIALTFGTPKPGDKQFQQSVDTLAPRLQVYSVANRGDNVPQCGISEAPCPEEDFLHAIGHVIWYPGNLLYGKGSATKTSEGPSSRTTDYVECGSHGSDPGCLNSVPASAFNHRDHDFYLNHSMWCCDAAAPDLFAADPLHCKFAFGKPSDIMLAGRGSLRASATTIVYA